MTSVRDYLKTEYSSLEPREALGEPPSILLGVTSKAAELLRGLEIRTVFDLALSTVFANASKLLGDGLDGTTSYKKYGGTPSDVLDSTVDHSKVSDLSSAPITVLAGIGSKNGPPFVEALDVQTVRDLALWPPYHAARAILNAVFNPEVVPGFDPEAPTDLIPKSGEYPTDRVFYKTIVLDQIDRDRDLKPLELAGPIDIAPTTQADFGFERPAIGAVLTFVQSWYRQGVALGNLLHSVALAPGESTRIAMIDWSRRTRSGVIESITETEALTNTMGHNRSISEVTQAVAVEAQGGFSGSAVNSTSSQFGAGAAAGVVGVIPVEVPVVAGGLVGAAYGTASSATTASGFSVSSGRRDLSASMSQNVMDSTYQAANAARNRRASIVREVSQSESENVSTRVVTNYNHMHALSIAYYEVVQLYRVTVQLSEVEKCLFIPMMLVNFHRTDITARFRHVLAAVGLTPQVRALAYAEPNMLAISAPNRKGNWHPWTLKNSQEAFGQPVGEPTSHALTFPLVDVASNVLSIGHGEPFESVVVEMHSGQTFVTQ